MFTGVKQKQNLLLEILFSRPRMTTKATLQKSFMGTDEDRVGVRGCVKMGVGGASRDEVVTPFMRHTIKLPMRQQI